MRTHLLKKEKNDRIAYVFLLPSIISVLLFSLIPLIMSFGISLTDWNFTKGLFNWNFVGIDNFISIWKDAWFLSSLKNTLIITCVSVPISLFLSVVIAILIDKFFVAKLAGILRVMMFMPHICNIVASSAIWMALFSSYGPFTNLMRQLGWKEPPSEASWKQAKHSSAWPARDATAFHPVAGSSPTGGATARPS